MIIFIPIKEKSQRVPNKNFRLLDNTPLFKKCLLKLKDHQVYVDTDSQKIMEEIKDDADLNHVYPYRRESSLEGHEVSVCDLIENFINKFSITKEFICQIHVTSPFLTVKTIEKAFEKTKKNHDSVVSCNLYQNRLWRKEKYGYCPVNHNPVKLEQTQDLPIFYEENSLFYIFKADNFKKTKLRIGSSPYFYECTFPENLDIDTEEDWKRCELLTKSGVI